MVMGLNTSMASVSPVSGSTKWYMPAYTCCRAEGTVMAPTLSCARAVSAIAATAVSTTMLMKRVITCKNNRAVR